MLGIPASTEGGNAQQAAPLPSPSLEPPVPPLLVGVGTWGCQRAPHPLHALVMAVELYPGLVPLGQWCPSLCVLARLETCLLPLSWNICPFCWSCYLIQYLHRGLTVLGRAKRGDAALLCCSAGGLGRTLCCLWVCPGAGGWWCHRVPHCNMRVSRPPGSPGGGKEGRGLWGRDPPEPHPGFPALHLGLLGPGGLRG